MKPEQKRSNSQFSIQSIGFIMYLRELQLFKLVDRTKENLQTCVDEINSKIREWIKHQAVFILIYNKVIEGL